MCATGACDLEEGQAKCAYYALWHALAHAHAHACTHRTNTWRRLSKVPAASGGGESDQPPAAGASGSGGQQEAQAAGGAAAAAAEGGGDYGGFLGEQLGELAAAGDMARGAASRIPEENLQVRI